MKIPVYWCNIDNFGDALNSYIFKELAQLDVKNSPLSNAVIIGIGSLLDNCLIDKNTIKIKRPAKMIFSSGFGFEEGGFFHNPNIILPEKLAYKIKSYALRGKLTKARIEKLTGEQCSAVLGDAGLLASYLIDKTKIKIKYDLGIVPHYADSQNPIFKQILNDIPNSVILNPCVGVKKFLKNLCECKCVISTAMHPLIACDALRIPNKWVRISEKTTSRYKFLDYYSVFNILPEPIDLNKVQITSKNLNDIMKSYRITDDMVQSIQKRLLKALEQLQRDIHSLYWKYFFYKIYFFLFRKFIKILCLFIPFKRYRKKLRKLTK